MKKLGGWFNPDATKFIEETNQQIEHLESSDNDSTAMHQSGREIASSAIDLSLLHFAFYAKHQFVDPSQRFTEEYQMIQEEPITFCQAWDHPDPHQQDKWRAAIKKEFCDMT